jgi:hypothetical protein
MSDTAPRSPVSAPQMLADALLRSATGAAVHLRVARAGGDASQSELGIVAANFAEIILGPAVMRKQRPTWQQDGQSEWELLLSATSVEQQVRALDIASAQALFAMALAVTVAGQEYAIETVASNEAFGQVYLYRLLLRKDRD